MARRTYGRGRPLGITILAGLGLLKSVILILLGALLSIILIGIPILIIGVIGLVLYYWLLQMKRIALYIILVLEVISLLGSLIGLVSGVWTSIIGVAWASIVIWYLWTNQRRFH